MPRPQQIHFQGALFHITSRGNDRRDIFLHSSDFERYLERVEVVKKKFPFKLFAYCLMPNHIHLLVEVDKTPLSKIMQALQTGHTMHFNKKYQHTGHIFQGRYFWLLVEKESYLLELIRYICLNPVRAGLVSLPEAYKWSSYSDVAACQRDSLVEREEVLAYFSQNESNASENFKEFIKGGMGKKREDLFNNVARDQFLGSPKFIIKTEKHLQNNAK